MRIGKKVELTGSQGRKALRPPNLGFIHSDMQKWKFRALDPRLNHLLQVPNKPLDRIA